MKYYNSTIVKEFVKNSKEPIKSISVGMREDWYCTAETVYENGEFALVMDIDTPTIGGIKGSYWATPSMHIEYENGKEETLPCFTSDNETVDVDKVARMKSFAATTGGMDYKE